MLVLAYSRKIMGKSDERPTYRVREHTDTSQTRKVKENTWYVCQKLVPGSSIIDHTTSSTRESHSKTTLSYETLSSFKITCDLRVCATSLSSTSRPPNSLFKYRLIRHSRPVEEYLSIRMKTTHYVYIGCEDLYLTLDNQTKVL